MPLLASLPVAAASAGLLALALPNEWAYYGSSALGFICLAPFFVVIAQSRSYRSAALTGAVFGGLAHAFGSYWLFFFQDYAFWTIGATSIAYALLYMLLAAYLRRFSRPSFLRPFLVAAVWTVWEWLKSTGFLGYPWGLVAYAVHDIAPLIQIVDGTGVYGLSYFLALSNALIAETVLSWGRDRGAADRRRFAAVSRLPFRGYAVFTAIGIWFLVYGWSALAKPTPIVDTVSIVLVQHNADSWEHGGELRALTRSQELSRHGIAETRARGKDPALVVWSETVLRRPFDDYRPFFRKNPPRDPFIPFLAELGLPLLTGAPIILDWDTYDATNSAILLGPEAEIRSSYAKMQLVPFAESIPFMEYSWMRSFMSSVVGIEGGWTMGAEATVMEVATASGRPLRFGVPICFEDAFSAVCARFVQNGADILINLTNDSWSRRVSAETQHLVASRFRTIENRRVLVRSTNGGVTAVIDAEGRILASLPLFTEAFLSVDVPVQIAASTTTYAVLGDWLPVALFILLVVQLLWARRLDFRIVLC